MSNKDKLFELMDKSDLSDYEKSILEELIKDDELRDLYNTHKLTEKTVRLSSHPTLSDLNDYVLIKNNLEPEDGSSLNKVSLIDKHLDSCSECNRLYLELLDEFNETEQFVTSKPETKKMFFASSGMRYAYMSMAAMMLIIIGAYFISFLVTPSSIRMGSLQDNSELYITRGRATDDFQRSLIALENNDYSAAEELLKKDLNSNNDETVFYSSYILGLTYLKSAEKNIVGLFPSYNTDKVKNGIDYLQKSISMNNSGKYPNLIYDAQFYTGKGYLMLNNSQKAAEYFQKVIESRGSKMEEAQNILSSMK